jgi:hypothetical protein
VHVGLILLHSTRTRSRSAIAAVAGAIESVLRDHPDGLSGSERWIGPRGHVATIAGGSQTAVIREAENC